MNFISFLGVIVLLGIAWIISYDRQNIPYKIIIWGIGLQFVFALIILREDIWSFIGMCILGLLIIAFQFKNFSKKEINTKQFIVTVLTLFTVFYCYSNNYTGRIIFQNFSEKVASFLSLSDFVKIIAKEMKFLFSQIIKSRS